MAADNFTAVMTGNSILTAGSQTVTLALLCGVSGTNAIPLRCLSDGTLATSGA